MNQSAAARPRPPVGAVGYWFVSSRPLDLQPPAASSDPTMPPSITLAAIAFGWGLSTGGAAGAVLGAVVGALTGWPGLFLAGAVVGMVAGMVAAALPTAIGAAGVADLARRQPLPLSPEGMAADLGRLFAQLVSLLLGDRRDRRRPRRRQRRRARGRRGGAQLRCHPHRRRGCDPAASEPSPQPPPRDRPRLALTTDPAADPRLC